MSHMDKLPAREVLLRRKAYFENLLKRQRSIRGSGSTHPVILNLEKTVESLRAKIEDVESETGTTKGKEMPKNKSFYVVSALTGESIGERNRYATEKEAIARAKEVIARRAEDGTRPMDFYVLKVSVLVSPVKPIHPVKIARLK